MSYGPPDNVVMRGNAGDVNTAFSTRFQGVFSLKNGWLER